MPHERSQAVDAPHEDPPVIAPEQTYASVTDKISSLVLSRPTTRGWLAGFGFSMAGVLVLIAAVGYLLYAGVGVWGPNAPVGWGVDIVNFVWWVGIGHAGSLLSASLLILNQDWRNSISRFAETMSLFAVMCAGLFPLLHMGRPWFFYWLLPYPNTMDLWPQFRSALVWDVFALMIDITVLIMFWYVGMIPSLATLRDRAGRGWTGRIYAVLAMGWRGDVVHWRNYQLAYLLLAGLATALVVAVHSVVALDFAISVVPGWHSTILPPYFLAAAVHSGLAMIAVLAIPLRRIYSLEEFITDRHLENLARMLVVTALAVGGARLMEVFGQWYSGNPAEWRFLRLAYFGEYAWITWILLVCNIAAPQVFWIRRLRSLTPLLFAVAVVVLIGMWLERHVLVIASLHQDFLPSSWGPYTATIWDWALFLGTFGLFCALFFAFVRLLPMISISEMREIAEEPEDGPRAHPQDTPYQATSAPLYGLLAEFENTDTLAEAVRRLREAGYAKLEAYTPVAAEQVREALGLRRSWLPALVLGAGVTGAALGYFLQYYLNAVDYPLNVAGRPPHSWPAFVVVTFTMAVLMAALAAVGGMLLLSGLPRLHHPLFSVPRFSLASRNRFFLCVRSSDLQFRPVAQTQRALEELRPLGIWEAPA